MKISVKREHIDNGVALSSTCCPIALACKDAGLKNVWINPLSIHYCLDDSVCPLFVNRVTLPVEVIKFIARFDAGEYVTMFSFDLPT